MKIRQCFLELQLKMSGMFFETHCSIVSLILCKKIFKHGDIQNISLTPDKELNILIYRTPYYVII